MESKLIKTIISLFIVCFSIQSYANDDHSDEHRHHEAHVHGEAELSLLIDGKSVVFELKSPALNVLGFEHEPKTNEEKEIVKKANKKLSNYKNIISIPDLNCQVIKSEIDSPYEEDHHHDHDHHDEHHDEDVEHGDYYLSYSLTCENMNKLKTIEVKLFDNFDGFENIEAVWIGQNGSGSSELTKEEKIITIK